MGVIAPSCQKCMLCCRFVNGKCCHRYVIVSSVCSLQFPMGAGGDGPLGGMAGMEPHHMNGSLGTAISHFFFL